VAATGKRHQALLGRQPLGGVVEVGDGQQDVVDGGGGQLSAVPPVLARRRRVVVVRRGAALRVVPAAVRVDRRRVVVGPVSARWTRRWMAFRPRSMPALAAAVPLAVARSSCRLSLRFSLISSATMPFRFSTTSAAAALRLRVVAVPRVARVVRAPAARRVRRFGALSGSESSAIN
jgi:hypothetical protein